MATTVSIQIAVDAGNSQAAIDGISQKLNEIGVVGQVSLKQASDGLNTMGGHAATSLDSVRLLSQEFGLRLPRAIESMLSRMPAVTGALNTMLGAVAGVAAVEIFARIGEEIAKAFDMGGERARALQKAVQDTDLEMRRMNTSLDVQIDKLQQEQAKLEHKPFNGMKLAIDEAADAADVLAQKIESINSKFAKDVIGGINSRGFAGYVQNKLGVPDEVQNMIQDHSRYMDEAQNLPDQQKEEASYAKVLKQKLAEAQVMQQTAQGSGLDYSNYVDELKAAVAHQQKESLIVDKSGDRDHVEAQVQKDRDAASAAEKSKTAALEAERQRQQGIELTARLQAQANEAGLRGDELIEAKRREELKSTYAKLEELHQVKTQWAADEAAINQRYDAEQKARIAQQIEQAEKALRDAQSAGLTGAPKIEAQRTAKDADIDASSEDPKAKALRHKAVEVEYNQEMAALQDENRKRKELEDRQVLERQQANTAEDLRYTQEATQAEARVRENGATGWVASYHNAVTEIQTQEQQRLAKLKEDATKEQLSTDEVRQRDVDIHRAANAEIEEQNQQLQQKIAGTLESAFRDPVGTIKSAMEKMMFEILAQWISQLSIFKRIFGSTMSGVMPGGGGVAGSSSHGAGIINMLHGGSSASGVGASGGESSQAGGATATPASSVGGGRSPGASIGSDISSGISGVSQLGGLIGIGGSSSTPGVSTAGDGGAGSNQIAQIATPGGDQIPLEDAPTYDSPEMQAPSADPGPVGYASAALAGYSAEQTTVSAFKQGSFGGIMSGTLGDAAAGAAIGSVIPGIGTAVGAVVGAAVGFASGLAGAVMGMGGKLPARDYYKQTIFPAIEADRTSQGDPMSTISDLNRTAVQGMQYMASHFGEDAADWVKANYMDKEVALATSQISKHAAGGSQYTARQAVEFHTGGYIGGFGDMGTSGNEGFIHALLGEAVMNTQAVARHAPAINAMNDGASHADVAAMYLRGGANSSNAPASSGGDTHLHVHTLDTQTMTAWLRNGGARMILKAQNNLAGQYAGEGVIG